MQAGGVPRIPLHHLRHAHATLLLLDGVPTTLGSKRLGHATFSIMLSRYSHILPGFQHLALESIGHPCSDDLDSRRSTNGHDINQI
jgi:integrase